MINFSFDSNLVTANMKLLMPVFLDTASSLHYRFHHLEESVSWPPEIIYIKIPTPHDYDPQNNLLTHPKYAF